MKIYLIAILTMVILSCNSTSIKTKETTNKENNKDRNEMKIYIVQYDIATPFAIYVNGIEMIAYNGNGAQSSSMPINEFLNFEEDVQKLQLVLKGRGNNPLAKNMTANVLFNIYEADNLEMQNLRLIQAYEVPIQSEPIDTITDSILFSLPKKVANVLGWSKSITLDLEDGALKKEVIAYYEKLFDLFNRGESAELQKLYTRKNEEVLEAYNYSSEIKAEQQELKSRTAQANRKMVPIDFSKYKLRVYANSKLVTLQNDDGDSPLRYSTPEYDDYFGVILHRPKENGELEIIR